MNPTPDNSHEQDLESLHGAWRALSTEQPPALIDQAVLNSSRRALERPARSWPWTRGWIHNLATAAVVLVAVTLLLQLREELPAPDQDPDARPDNALREAADSGLASPEPGAEMEISSQAAPIEADAPAARAAGNPAAPVAESRQEMRLHKSEAAEAAGNVPADAAYAELEKLWQSGDQAAFRERLAEFRATWPDYPLPAAWLE